MITYKIHKYRNLEAGFPGNHGDDFVLLYERILSDVIVLQILYGGSDSTFKTDSEKPKICILLGSIRDPLYFFFFKGVIPNYSKASVGAKSLEIPWVVAGRGVSENLNSCLSGVTAGNSQLHFLSLVQKERPQEWPAAFRL